MPTLPTSLGRSNASGSNKHNGQSEEEESLKPYVKVAHVGKGSFATVFKGYHETTHQQVAIKVVERNKLTAKLFDNLKSEIDILKSLSHRHITKLLDIVRTEQTINLVMEYCSGGDLTNYIKKRGRVETLEYIPSPGSAPQYYPHPRTGGLAETVVRSFLRQLARALKFLRKHHLSHRDIKPQNLLLNPASKEELARGHPLGVPIMKVADFGFARSLPNAMMAETLCGSPLYMAPEILRYEKYDAKADLWSVGAVLYEMCVGKSPYRAQNHIELLKKIEQSRGVKFPDEDPSRNGDDIIPVPDDIKQLIRMLLKRNPVERASFEDFFASPAIANSKFPRPREPSPPPPPQPTVPAQPAPEQPLAVNHTDSPKQPRRSITPEQHRAVPSEALDPATMIPPSRFNFRRPSGGEREGRSGHSELDQTPVAGPSTEGLSHPPARPQIKPLSTEGSVIPGETEEDGALRREYVLVDDTRAVEFNRAVDELASVPRRPLQDRRIPSTPTVDVYPPTDDIVPSPSNTTFPPPPNPALPPLSSSPSSIASRAASNALSRAISMASKKLFGTQTHRHRPSREYATPPSPRRPQLLRVEDGAQRDPLEDELLASLESLAQKTDVLTNWADEMYEAVKAIPQKPLPDPTKFAKREGEAEKQARRRMNADLEAEYNAVTAVAVYILLMSFSQKGIDMLRKHQEHMKMRHPDGYYVVSKGFDDALLWFKEHFMKCNDRAALIKTWLPQQYEGPRSYIDQLVYDRALLLSRTAARKELLDQTASPEECLKLYEESLWCLYALQDDLLRSPSNPFDEDDQNTIATWIKRTKLRLIRCQERMEMNKQERLNDARADVNLADVARIPATWDGKGSPSSPLR